MRRRDKEILELSKALTTAGDLDSLLKRVIERLVDVLEPLMWGLSFFSMNRLAD